jgi:tripartite-type tricarboxylate transporter receptor subunit TctC
VPAAGEHSENQFSTWSAHVGAAALPGASRLALAQAYPTRPVRIIVAAAAGGASDILARLFGQWLSEQLGQAFVVENRPGASNNIGTEAVVRRPPNNLADDFRSLLKSNQFRALAPTQPMDSACS